MVVPHPVWNATALVELRAVAYAGIHPPEFMPFRVPWTEGIGSDGFVESFDTAWTFVAVMAVAAGAVILLAYKRPEGAPEPDVELVPSLAGD